ncbi:type II toxin-antitoxin system VapC family toxin [Candidatus Woesearchaeota archaeon]|nr:type II toxin-antitoxin system VapC family toxin [Candidatus Woesearchaeota archaeon]
MAVFLDAGYFLALYNENDVHHKRAVILAEKIDANEFGQAITSDHIFDEAVSVALRKFGKEKAQALGKQILDSVFMVQCDRHLFDAAFQIFNSSNEPFSFTDCTSQAIMDLVQIKFIATFDRLFEKLNVEVLN